METTTGTIAGYFGSLIGFTGAVLLQMELYRWLYKKSGHKEIGRKYFLAVAIIVWFVVIILKPWGVIIYIFLLGALSVVIFINHRISRRTENQDKKPELSEINEQKQTEIHQEKQSEERLSHLQDTRDALTKAGQPTEKIDKMIAELKDATKPTANEKIPEKPNKGGFFKAHPWMMAATIIFIAFIIGLVITGQKGNQKINPETESTIPTTIQTQQWQTFSSAQDQFSVLLPTYPTYDSKENMPTDNPLLTYSSHSYIAKSSKATYYVYKYFYSSTIDTSDSDGLFEKLLNGMVNSDPNSQLVSSQYTYVGSYRALDFLIRNKQEYLKGRVVLANQTRYTLMMDYVGQNYNDENYNKFINSFQFQSEGTFQQMHSETTAPTQRQSVQSISPQPTTPAPSPAQPTWHTVFTYSGESSTQTAPFRMRGSQWKVTYSCAPTAQYTGVSVRITGRDSFESESFGGLFDCQPNHVYNFYNHTPGLYYISTLDNKASYSIVVEDYY